MLLSRQGVPHQSTSDDLYKGYHIPADSVVFANQWWEHSLFQNSGFSLFLQLYAIGRCWTTNDTTQNPASSGQNAFYGMENSMIQLGTRWTSHLDLVGGQNDAFVIYSFV